MRRIVHHELGQPEQVLRVEDGPPDSLGPDQVRIRVSYAPIHPGDLLGVMGSPAFGTPPTISSGGRVPGFEGAGVVSDVGARIDPGLGLKLGLRVAFFPAPGSWRDEVVVPAGSVVPLPDSIPDEIGAQMLINTATALTAIRTAHESLPTGRPPRGRRDFSLEPDPLSGGFSPSFLLTEAQRSSDWSEAKRVPRNSLEFCQDPQFLRRTLLAGRTTPGPPLRGRRFTPRSTASAGAC